MAFLFRNKYNTTLELCRSTKELLLKLHGETTSQPRIEEQAARLLGQMKLTLQGTPAVTHAEIDATQQQTLQMIECLTQEDVLYPLSLTIHKLPFEARKDAQIIFSHCLRFKCPPDAEHPYIVRHVLEDRPAIIHALCHGYDHRESSMACGGILREAVKTDCLAALILYDEPLAEGERFNLGSVNPETPATGKGIFWKFFNWIDQGAFEVSADAFNTFREILTRHKKLVSHFLVTNQELFTQSYNTILVQSTSYVTKRQSIKLLSELLLDRSNYDLMTAYIDSAANLKLCMQLLRDDRRMLNYEGFHVFKVFVANPNKSLEVQRILIKNRERLLRFLPSFLEDRTEDVQFADEKAYCIRVIEELPTAPIPRTVEPGRAAEGGNGAENANGMVAA